VPDSYPNESIQNVFKNKCFLTCTILALQTIFFLFWGYFLSTFKASNMFLKQLGHYLKIALDSKLAAIVNITLSKFFAHTVAFSAHIKHIGCNKLFQNKQK
jgi:hypothetical protein